MSIVIKYPQSFLVKTLEDALSEILESSKSLRESSTICGRDEWDDWAELEVYYDSCKLALDLKTSLDKFKTGRWIVTEGQDDGKS